MTVEVRQATPHEAARWDAFAAQAGSFFHRYGWADVISQTYGHRPIYLIAERGGEITGLLPLIDRKSVLFGRALISTAFTVGGGVAAIDEESAEALTARAIVERDEAGADYVELRSASDAYEGWQAKHGVYDTFDCPLIADQDERLKAIPRKKRADIRKAIKKAEAGEITIRQGVAAREFWRHYAVAQRDHGTPIMPPSFLEHQVTAFADDLDITFVEADGQALAGVMTYYHRGTASLYNAFITGAARQYHAGDYLYWWMMGRAVSKGAHTFDLGRSKPGTGSHAYKTYWGFEPKPLNYLYALKDDQPLPNINPKNPKFAALSATWKRLPLPVANRLGPLLAGHLA